MRWQFEHAGGNLQPVRMICEIDWWECPSAIINYVWSEIVTDVVECLTNEWMIWRVIAMLFVCTLLIHTIYSKTRLMDETTLNRDNLNVVGCKVQDLELKVNILTYKMQYGTWPLPRQIRGTGVEGGIRNVRLTLTNSNDRNAWLKHMLLSPSENASCVPYAKIGPRSVRCLTKLINLETKYMSSKFARDPSPMSNIEKSSRSTSEKSLNNNDTSKKSLDIDITKRVPRSENFGMRNRDNRDITKNQTNNSWSETRVLKYREYPKNCTRNFREINIKKISSKKFGQFDKTPEERVNTTNETLHQVKEKLENLHSVLRIYGGPLSGDKESGTSNKKLAETILEDLKNIGNLPESESDGKHSDLTTKNVAPNVDYRRKNEDDEIIESTSEFEQCRSDQDFSASSIDENSTKNQNYVQNDNFVKNENYIKNEKQVKNEDCKIENLSKNIDTSRMNLKNIEQIPMTIFTIEKTCKDSHLSKIPSTSTKNIEKSSTEEKSGSDDATVPSPFSSKTELSKDSDNDDKTNVALLREALKFKNALITQIEFERMEKSVPEQKSDSESDEAIWPKVKNYFHPKLLDIISEEQSASSSTEKTARKFAKNENIANNKITDIANEENQKFSLDSKSSEYFSLSNINHTLMKKEHFHKINEILENSNNEKIIENSNNEKFDEYNENHKYTNKENLEKNLNDLVNKSVKNIRDYIEVFSYMQETAITDAKRAINDESMVSEKIEKKNEEKDDFLINSKETLSIDSMTRFVNTCGETMSEELPRKLSEPAIIRLVDLEVENFEKYSPTNSDYELKRRPGTTSLAEENFYNEKTSSDHLDTFFESANSDDSPLLESEPSCKELLMDYSQESGSDFNDEEIVNTTNLMVFEEEINERDDYDEKSRIIDSPLTGRTVIRATGSYGSTVDLSTNESRENVNYEETRDWHVDNCPEVIYERELVDIEEYVDIEMIDTSDNAIPETSSIYFTDQSSLTRIRTNYEDFNDDRLRDVESSTWIAEDETKQEVKLKNEKFYDEPEAIMERENFDDKPEVGMKNENFVDDPETRVKDESFENKPEVRLETEYFENKPDTNELTLNSQVNLADRSISGDAILINSSKIISTTNEISNKLNVASDTSATFMDASSREFLNFTGNNLKFDKTFANSSPSKSARGSASSPLQQHVLWTTPRRGSSLNNATTDKTKKIEKNVKKSDKIEITSKNTKTKGQQSKNVKATNQQLVTRSNFNINGAKDLESSNITIGQRAAHSNVDIRERRSRSYVTPRKNENSPRICDNSENNNQRLARTRKKYDFVKTEKSIAGNSRNRLNKDSPRNFENFESNDSGLGKNEKNTKNIKSDKSSSIIDPEGSKSCAIKESPRNYENFVSNESGRWKKREKDIDSQKSPTNIVKSERSASLLSKSSSKSCIPVLRSRLEAVRQLSHEKRVKSPSRCPLTISTSGWNQELRSTTNFPSIENIRAEGSPERSANENLKTNDKRTIESTGKISESRTVIYVNIVTEKEHKSATRVVDPKKFLEYLKDRELKVQSIQNEEISSKTEKTDSTSVPKILTIVSSAVDEKSSEDNYLRPDIETSQGTWSVRVEQREIEVSAKPSVMDTSTSISDLPDATTNFRNANNGKFQIFDVPQELTKDEYILLLEALNQDPNLRQLREMHKLCNKLGLGFHESS